MQVNSKVGKVILRDYLKAKLVPFLKGSPGCGKSALIKELANDYGLKVIDLRLSQCDPTDLNGFPTIKGKKASYTPMDTFPLEGEEVPEGYNGWLLFLDEFNSAPTSVQAAAYKIVLDNMVGQNRLHSHVAIVCAGNLDTDNAITEQISSALRSRLVHLELINDAKVWTDWAETDGQINHLITSFIKFKPNNLFTFNPDSTDETYACPRTWEFANKLILVTPPTSKHFLIAMAGVLGEGVAREFQGFCKISESLPKMAQIISNPMGIPMSTEPSVLFALSGAIGANANEDNIDSLMAYVNRMPKEFQIVTLRSVVKKNPALCKSKALSTWLMTTKTELLDD